MVGYIKVMRKQEIKEWSTTKERWAMAEERREATEELKA
jgi:hypothetical protein